MIYETHGTLRIILLKVFFLYNESGIRKLCHINNDFRDIEFGKKLHVNFAKYSESNSENARHQSSVFIEY